MERETHDKSAAQRVVMLGTFGFQPKGTMSARAAGIAHALTAQYGWGARITTVPWDSPSDGGRRWLSDGVEYVNTRTVRPAVFPMAIRDLVKATHCFRPDIVHLFKPKGFGDLAARILHRGGLPVIVDMDDWEGFGGWNDLLPYNPVQKALFDWQERTWPPNADAVTVASRTLYQRAIELGAAEDRVFYVPNGISNHRFQALRCPALAPAHDYPQLERDTENILLYTRFVEFQPEFVIEVLDALSRRIPNARLIVAGGSPDGSAERRMMVSARRAGTADRIHQIGWLDPRNLGHLARQCSAVFVPFDDTLVNRAKCSVKLVELMACGIPIVASNVGENREYLGSGRYGWLASPGDAASHASALVSAIRSRAVGDNRADLAAIRVRDAYSWETLATSVMSAYQRSVASKTQLIHS